ncbi:hypothetical protein F5Y14DRAFT_290422 [Nemania sp. NC0429]|nr:hypothetical protein F5Y14DRAFT_290422 [Nemania sp. NC0429]
MVSKITKTATWPFRATRQAWGDFKKGRQVRKDEERKQEEQEEQTTSPETERSREELSQSSAIYKHRSKGLQRRKPRSKGEGWARQRGEYPWRIEQLVHLDDNTRGTWVLEAKDLSAIVWEKEFRMKGSRLKTETVPQPHWPFPRHLQQPPGAKREPDELLNWLSR